MTHPDRLHPRSQVATDGELPMVTEVVQVATFIPTLSRLVQRALRVKLLSWPRPLAPNSSEMLKTMGCLAYRSTQSIQVLIISSSLMIII